MSAIALALALAQAAPVPPIADAPPEASAESPPAAPPEAPHQRFVLSALVGYGTASLNTNLGLRIGYTTRSRFFVAGAFDYFFGESSEQGSGGFFQTSGVTYFMHQLEIGYSGKVGPVELRPYGGLGPAFGFSYTDGYLGQPGQTSTTAVASTGLVVAIDIGKHAFAGIDGRGLLFVSSIIPQAAFGGVVGARF